MGPARWRVLAGRTVALEATRAEPDLDALLIPGLVNAHAHLDLAGGAAVTAEGSFPEWLLGVGRVRQDSRDVAGEAAAEAAHLGARGVVAVGDIDASRGVGTAGRRRAGVGGRSYLEIVGVSAPSARASLARNLGLADRLGGGTSAVGLSPHAPYSVHHGVVPEIVRAARARGLPLAMHLAESEEETRFLLAGDGPFRRFLEAIGKGLPAAEPPGVRPVAWAEATGFLAAGGVVIHGNDLDGADLAALARHRSPVVYCHGTHRHFDRPPHRFPELLEAGVPVALGTDSGLSNAGVDLLGEIARLLSDRPDVSALTVLGMATEGGWRALGHDPGPAWFEAGSPAHGVLLGGDLPDGDARPRDLAEWALGGAGRVQATIHAGRAVSSQEGSPSVVLDTLETPR